MAELSMELMAPGGEPEVAQRVASMSEALRPIFLALPRSKDGYLGPSAVRYLLHRFFVDRDGWFVQGWDVSGEEADGSFPVALLQGGGGELARMLSEWLVARGLDLREVAILAVALETLTSLETEQRLRRAYEISNLGAHEQSVTEEELNVVLRAYTVMYVMGYDHKDLSSDDLIETMAEIHTAFPKWDDFSAWFQGLREEVAAKMPEQQFSFKGQLRILEEMQRRYGRWQDLDCQAIKDGLLQYSTPDTGRVPLTAFYSVNLPGGWVPTESKEYLEEIGAVDESDPRNPSVVIANYFDTPSNCINTSSYYYVCCISGCEALLSHVEREVASPNASPAQIVDIVQNLPSATVGAPRTLPASLVERLEGVASFHGGHAPLHGRLFRQWMHHAFPAECAFPALSMAEKPRSPDEFEMQTGRSAEINEAMLKKYRQEEEALKEAKATLSQAERDPDKAEEDPQLANDEGRPDPHALDKLLGTLQEAKRQLALEQGALELELPWSDEEELFIACRSDGTASSAAREKGLRRAFVSWRGAFLVAFVASMALKFVQTVKSTRSCVLPVHAKTNKA